MDVLDRLAALQNLDKLNSGETLFSKKIEDGDMLEEEESDEKVNVKSGNVDGDNVVNMSEICEQEMNCDDNQPAFTWKNNSDMMQIDFVDFPNVGMTTKTRNKSRSQPKRKTSSKKIDYCDKKRNTPKRKETFGGRFIKRLKKKDNLKSDKILRVKRKSVMDIHKMKKLRKQTRENRLRNERNMKLALQSGGFLPARTTHVTKPKEFNFSMCNRLKEHTMSTRSSTDKPFETNLRTDSNLHAYKNENTKPVPFKFAVPNKAMEQKENWESFAQTALKFQTKTPTRYRNKPSEEDKLFLEKKVIKKPCVTMPITPKLLTRGRSRRYKVEAAKELEEKELNEMINFKFKATEFNPRIVEMKGMYGVKSVPVSVSTEVKPFNFEIEQRILNRTCKDTTMMAEVTVDTMDKSKISCGKLRPTQPKPFSFENKDKERYIKKEEKIKGQILAEKKMHEFQAGLLPSFSPDVLPAVLAKKNTKLKPFNISDGSASYQAKLDIKMKMEAGEEHARRQFKAKPADVVKKQPFQPLTGVIPPTSVSNITLNTEARAEQRGNQQYWKTQKEKFHEEERIEEEKEKELAEELEIKNLRKRIVHKAKPIPNFKPLKIKKSQVPLTQPETPNLEVKRRALSRLEDSRDNARF